MQKIMFNDKYGLTQAVLDGRKTQTRRIAHAGYIKFPNTCIGLKGNNRNKLYLKNGRNIVAHSRYKVCEEVAIAQSYRRLGLDRVRVHNGKEILEIPFSKGWKNKMYVKADLMPHRIRITSIRAERLQDITDEDCFAEGVVQQRAEGVNGEIYSYIPYERPLYYTPREAYAALIDKISGKGTWASNPYVFVYEFELIK